MEWISVKDELPNENGKYLPLEMMKYKPCCNSVCLLNRCEVRDNGGCYCVCRLIDYMKSWEDIVNGDLICPFLYFSDKKMQKDYYERNKAECDKYKADAPKILEDCREELKKYEIKQ